MAQHEVKCNSKKVSHGPLLAVGKKWHSSAVQEFKM